MTEIDRRSLIRLAGAGAGLLLTGTARAQCPPLPEPGAGGCEQHGQPVTDEKPQSEHEGENAPTFDPEYVCVLYVRFTPDRTLKVRTAYVRPTKPYHLASVVKPILDDLSNNNNVNAVKQADDLEDFTFGSQHEIVIFIDNDPRDVGFDDRFELQDIIRFTPFLGSDPKEPAKKNNAFFNLQPLEFASQGPLRARIAYRLQYWNTDEEGNPIQVIAGCPGTYYRYSMNIHLKMAVKTRRGEVFWVPIILDPDTGNMGGLP